MSEIDKQGQDYEMRLKRAQALEARGINPYPAEPYPVTHKVGQLISGFSELEGSQAAIAGRLRYSRAHGKIIFAGVEDETGSIQTVWNQRTMGEKFDIARDHFDVGDVIGVSGNLTKTKTGEISVWADDVTMLTKSLRALPTSITDAEIMQRQRYLQTMIDSEARDRFRTRSRIVQGMRDYFINRIGCLEVETPVLDTTYGGAQATPFVTHHNALSQDMYLRISNELYLKRMTGSYLEGVFEFARDFRNEGMDRTHNPEFTLLELYKPFWDYFKMMDMAEEMMSGIVQQVHGKTEIPWRMAKKNGDDVDVMIDYKRPWRRVTVYDGLRDKYGIDPEKIGDSELRSLAHRFGVDEVDRGTTLLKLFEEAWEEDFVQPTFVMDYPASTSALTKRHRSNPELVERFEMYAGGMETMNCYTELNDPRDQRSRFQLELEKRAQGDKEAMPMDEDFILAQEYAAVPQQAGIGISVDRWTMLVTNTPHIRQVIYYPTLRPSTRI